MRVSLTAFNPYLLLKASFVLEIKVLVSQAEAAISIEGITFESEKCKRKASLIAEAVKIACTTSAEPLNKAKRTVKPIAPLTGFISPANRGSKGLTALFCQTTYALMWSKVPFSGS